MKKIIVFILLFCLATLALVISSQNNAEVSFNYLIAQQDFVFSEVLSIFFVVGAGIVTFAWWIIFTKSKLKMYQQQRKIDQLLNENERLRIQLKDL